MGFNKGAFQEFNAQDSLDDESSYRTLGDHWASHSLYTSNTIYAGHLFLISNKFTAIQIVNLAPIWADTNTDRIGNALYNTDLSPYISSDLIDLKAILVFIQSLVQISELKTQKDTYVYTRSDYSFTYNSSPSEYNRIYQIYKRSSVQDADNIRLQNTRGNTTIIPVVYNNKTPYITWKIHYGFVDMTSAFGNYGYQVCMYLLGYFK